MYNMHKESRSGNKKNEQFYERRELFSKMALTARGNFVICSPLNLIVK